MKPINLAVLFDQKPTSGGGYTQAIQYTLSALKIPKNLANVTVFSYTKAQQKYLYRYKITSQLIKFNLIDKIYFIIRQFLLYSPLVVLVRDFLPCNSIEKKLKQLRIDIAYFVSPSQWAGDFKEIHYISTFWDDAHQEFPEFPEVYNNHEFEVRHFSFQRQLRKAVAVIVESQHNKSVLINKYGIKQSRVYVTPLMPNSSLLYPGSLSDAENELCLDFKVVKDFPYIFYPAQFWSHKNHMYILEAIDHLRKEYSIELHCIFTGSDKGNRNFILEALDNMNLKKQVHIYDFVSDTSLYYLYRYAMALVMPSYFGPTNVPPIEAMCFDLPVFVPDLPGIRDQISHKCSLFDINNPSDLAEQLKAAIPSYYQDQGRHNHSFLKEYIEDALSLSTNNLTSILIRYSYLKRLFAG